MYKAKTRVNFKYLELCMKNYHFLLILPVVIRTFFPYHFGSFLKILYLHRIIVILFWILFSGTLDEDAQENALKNDPFVEIAA
jgi:hypothetical protein